VVQSVVSLDGGFVLRTRQRGFSLIEVIIVIAITSLIGTWAASSWMQHAEDSATRATGVWMLSIKQALDQMLHRQSDALVGIVEPNARGFQYRDVWRPTLEELIGAGHLPRGFPLRAPLAYSVWFRIERPQGDCLRLGCKIVGSIFAVPSSNERHDAEGVTRVGLLLSTIGGHAASVTSMSGPRVKGATIDVENPPYPDMSPLPPGSILMRSFYDSTQYAVFLRQDDQRDASLQGNLSVAKDLHVGGASKTKGRVSAGEYLQVGASAVAGGACESEGLIARATDLGLLVCQQGRWQRVDRGNGGGYLELSGFPCFENDDWIVRKRNPKTGNCTCPPGYEPFLMSVWKHPVMSLHEYSSFLCL
jgi:prepilin-type N-terminal cleavage/methylation domain-containing protein